jgi:menaquinone-dependent protoporphyrinogen IX oxidase
MERRKFLKTGLIGIGALAVAQKSLALEYYPKKSDKKWAVVYGTWCGSSRDAGVWISEGMGGIADVFDVRENPDIKGFDHVVIGGSIRSFQVSEELQDYLKENKEILKPKIRGFFAVCGNRMQPTGPQQVKQYIDDHLSKITGVSGVPARVFNGRVTSSLLSPQNAQMMKNMNMPDYDYMKRSDFLEFGKEILSSMK